MNQSFIHVRIGKACGLVMTINWMREVDTENLIFEMDSKLMAVEMKHIRT